VKKTTDLFLVLRKVDTIRQTFVKLLTSSAQCCGNFSAKSFSKNIQQQFWNKNSSLSF